MKKDPDPAVDEDGVLVCAVDAVPLNAITVKNGDPFCSTACANTFHEFEPSARRYTLGGNDPGHTGKPGVSKWDDGARHKRRKEREQA